MHRATNAIIIVFCILFVMLGLFVTAYGQTTVYYKPYATPTPTPTPTPSGITIVQAKYFALPDDAPSETSPAALTFDSPVTNGNRIIVMATHSYMGCAPTVSDTLTNSYTARGAQPAIGHSGYYWHVWDAVSSGGSNTVSITFACGQHAGFAILEVSGTSAYDSTAGQQTNSPSSGSPAVGPSITPSSSGALVLGWFSKTGTGGFTEAGVGTLLHSWAGEALVAYIAPSTSPVQLEATVNTGSIEDAGAIAYIP